LRKQEETRKANERRKLMKKASSGGAAPRAAFLKLAADFLSMPSVAKSTDGVKKKNFLLAKGCTLAEIVEAFDRAGVSF
jgi:hypothetical protein